MDTAVPPDVAHAVGLFVLFRRRYRLVRKVRPWEEPTAAEWVDLRLRTRDRVVAAMGCAVPHGEDRRSMVRAAWSAIWREWRVARRTVIAVRYALHSANTAKITLPRDHGAVERRLRDALERSLPSYERRLGLDGVVPDAERAQELDDLARAAANDHGAARSPRAVAMIWGSRGEPSKESTEDGPAPPRPEDWFTDPTRAARMLALVLLEQVVDGMNSSAATPALALAALDEIAETMWDRSTTTRRTDRGIELVCGDRVVADVPTALSAGLDRLDVGLLHRLVTHRLLRFMITKAHAQHLRGEAEPSILDFEGGLSAIARELDLRSKSAPEDVHLVLQLGQALRRTWAGGEAGGLWTYLLQRAAPGRPARVEVRLGALLMPRYVHLLPKDNRALVPIPQLPPFVGRERDHGGQAAFQMLLLRTMVVQRVELVRHGGARISPPDLDRLAHAASLPQQTLSRVIDRWVQDGDDGPACLVRLDGDRYHLPDNDAYCDARRFLEVGGQMSISAAKAGRASARAKRKRLGGASAP